MSSYHQASSGSSLADILILVAGDVSMLPVAQALHENSESSVAAGNASCPCDIVVTSLSVGASPFNGLDPDQSLKTYLTSLGKSGLKERDPGQPPADGDYDLENAVIDASSNFSWRQNAKRAILLMGNAWPDGGGPSGNNGTSNSKAAAAAATSNNVLVFTLLTQPKGGGTPDASVPTEYKALVVGGQYYDASKDADPSAQISKALQAIVCALVPSSSTQTGGTGTGSCGSVCDELPSILCTINLLACALNKAMDACCPNAGANTGCDCGCGGKKPPPPLWTPGNAAAIPRPLTPAHAASAAPVAARTSNPVEAGAEKPEHS